MRQHYKGFIVPVSKINRKALLSLVPCARLSAAGMGINTCIRVQVGPRLGNAGVREYCRRMADISEQGKRALSPGSAPPAKRSRNVDSAGAESAHPQSMSDDASAEDLVQVLQRCPDTAVAAAALPGLLLPVLRAIFLLPHPSLWYS